MATANGVVEQRNINALLTPVLEEFNRNKKADEYNTKLEQIRGKEYEPTPRHNEMSLGRKFVNSKYREYKSTGKYKVEINESTPSL